MLFSQYGVLNEGEFFFQTSEPIPGPSGFGSVAVITQSALLSRSPATQPCDVQKARGVWRPEYASCFDVIVVSARGSRPLCSLLSGQEPICLFGLCCALTLIKSTGGDYDGDKLVLTTNPALTSTFRQERADPRFADPPFEDWQWFHVDERRAGDHVWPLVEAGDSTSLAAILMEGLHAGTQYGFLSKRHTTLAYVLGLDHPLTSMFGHLFCRALDGRKQGLSFTPEKWAELQKEIPRHCSSKPRWTWRDEGRTAPDGTVFAQRPRALGSHPMGTFLLFPGSGSCGLT